MPKIIVTIFFFCKSDFKASIYMVHALRSLLLNGDCKTSTYMVQTDKRQISKIFSDQKHLKQ